MESRIQVARAAELASIGLFISAPGSGGNVRCIYAGLAAVLFGVSAAAGVISSVSCSGVPAQGGVYDYGTYSSGGHVSCSSGAITSDPVYGVIDANGLSAEMSLVASAGRDGVTAQMLTSTFVSGEFTSLTSITTAGPVRDGYVVFSVSGYADGEYPGSAWIHLNFGDYGWYVGYSSSYMSASPRAEQPPTISGILMPSFYKVTLGQPIDIAMTGQMSGRGWMGLSDVLNANAHVLLNVDFRFYESDRTSVVSWAEAPVGVPEPATFMPVAAGLAMALGWALRKARKRDTVGESGS